VERVIKQEVRARNYLALYELKAAEELRTAEMAVLTRLEAKYRSPANLNGDPSEEVTCLVLSVKALGARSASDASN
jgi:hypothetical protein